MSIWCDTGGSLPDEFETVKKKEVISFYASLTHIRWNIVTPRAFLYALEIG